MSKWQSVQTSKDKICKCCGTVNDAHHSAECIDTGGRGYHVTDDLRADVMDCIARYTDRREDIIRHQGESREWWLLRALQAEHEKDAAQNIAMLLSNVLDKHGY